MAREFDAIVFGASGFTGQYVVEEMAISMNMDALYKTNNLKWAVAGRNSDKISKVLKQATEQTNYDCSAIPIIVADVNNYESLVSMCKRTRLVISLVGPYRFYGEPLVKACIEAATNYVDISGEPQFLESMQLKYNQEAKDKGIYIVGAAGWDSVPADYGTTWTKQQFKGDLNGVDIIVGIDSPDGGKINNGTWVSAIYGYSKAAELKPLRQDLFKEVLKGPKKRSPYKNPRRGVLTHIDEVKSYCLPFPGSDKSVVRRSEIGKYQLHKERPVECETYFQVGGVFNGIMIAMAATVFGSLAKFSLGRGLLKRFPSALSFGLISKDGSDIPRSMLETRNSWHTIIGYGWNDKLDDPDSDHDQPPSKKIVTKISGPDPGYIGTAIYVVHTGMTLLFDQAKLPPPGVWSPGACCRDSYLINRLSARGIKFEVLETL